MSNNRYDRHLSFRQSLKSIRDQVPEAPPPLESWDDVQSTTRRMVSDKADVGKPKRTITLNKRTGKAELPFDLRPGSSKGLVHRFYEEITS